MDDEDKKKRTKRTPMSELPTVLLPEAEDPVIASLREDMAKAGPQREEELGAHLRFESEMPIEQAAGLLERGEVDILIAGQLNGSPEVLTEALNITKKRIPEERKHERPRMSSFFVMEKEGREEPIFLTDCAVNISPSTQQLVTIAEQTCESVAQLGYEPRVAFLSYSTFGSAKGPKVHLVSEAAQAFKAKHPDIPAYGEIQLDAAVDPEIFKKKAAKAGIELTSDMPNVFVFPDGETGNIAYKAIEQFGGYRATGPMLNGTLENIHDLSRGGTKESLLRSIELAAQLFEARRNAAQAHEGTQPPTVPEQ